MSQIHSSPTATSDVSAQYAGYICPLDEMFRKERAGLVRYLARRVGPEFANDLVQDVFLRAAASPQLSKLANPRAFLHRIAKNLLVDQARRQRCKIVTVDSAEPVESRCPAEQEYQLEAEELEAALARALGELPERTRTIFLMHRFDEMAYGEIKREFGISLAGVEYHMMKALAHVRARLRDRAAIPELGPFCKKQK
jgi:RNA polymerase sigma factor (sigma-70 family)